MMPYGSVHSLWKERMRILRSEASVSAFRSNTVVHSPASSAAAARATAPTADEPPRSTVWQKSSSSPR